MPTPAWRKLALLTGFLSDTGAAIADDLVTSETDDTFVLAADGAGGVEFRAETGGPPSGAAGGELSGTYPNPTVASTHSGSSHAGVITTHEAAGDPHPGYLTPAEGDLAYDPLGAAAALVLVPVGGIVLWSGTIASIPAPWALCDGTANSPGPDLRDRFIVGATSDDAGVAKTNLTGSLTQSGSAAVSAHALSTDVGIDAHALSTNVAVSAHALSTDVGIDAHALSTPVAVSAHALSTNAAIDAHALSTSVAVSAHALSTDVGVSAHALSTNVAVSAHTLSTNVAIDTHALTTNVAIANHTLGTSQGRTSTASTRAFATGIDAHTITQPVIRTHAVTQPVVSAHDVTQPVVSAHTLTQPVVSAHSVTQPVVSGHTLTQPVVSAHAITQPVVSGHTLTQPVVSVHGITQPVVSAHTLTQPVVSAHTTAWPTYFALAYIQRMS